MKKTNLMSVTSLSPRKILLLGALSVLAWPVGSGALAATTTISSVVSPVISLFTTSGTVSLNITPTAAGAQTTASDTVTISTNDSAGYTLTMYGGATTLTSGANNIASIAGTPAAPIALTANKWGWRVDSLSAFGAGPTTGSSNQTISAVKYAAMPLVGSPQTLATTATTASNAVTTVWYSAAADYTQPSGTYTQTVTYTATAN